MLKLDYEPCCGQGVIIISVQHCKMCQRYINQKNLGEQVMRKIMLIFGEHKPFCKFSFFWAFPPRLIPYCECHSNCLFYKCLEEKFPPQTILMHNCVRHANGGIHTSCMLQYISVFIYEHHIRVCIMLHQTFWCFKKRMLCNIWLNMVQFFIAYSIVISVHETWYCINNGTKCMHVFIYFHIFYSIVIIEYYGTMPHIINSFQQEVLRSCHTEKGINAPVLSTLCNMLLTNESVVSC